mgnify:CR=1 FL=1
MPLPVARGGRRPHSSSSRRMIFRESVLGRRRGAVQPVPRRGGTLRADASHGRVVARTRISSVTWRWRRSAASPERDATWTPRIKITSRMPRPDLGDISATTVQHLRHGSRAYLSDISDLARELVRSELLLLLVCCDRLGGDLFGRDHLRDQMYARNKEMISFGWATWTGEISSAACTAGDVQINTIARRHRCGRAHTRRGVGRLTSR